MKQCKELIRRNYLSTTKGRLVQARCSRKATDGSRCKQHAKKNH